MEGSTPPAPAVPPPPRRSRSTFRRFFVRGLAIVLPTVLTIWLLLVAYNFVDQKIGQPINAGLRELVIRFTDWPPPEDENFANLFADLPQSDKDAWESELFELRQDRPGLSPDTERTARMNWMKSQDHIILLARRHAFEVWWQQYRIGTWPVLNVFGLILAIILVYIVGAFLSRSIGNRLWRTGETAIQRVPLVGRVYPAFKQITDFIFGDGSDEKLKFNRVVAVQYPRKGLWSVGMVTGNTMRAIQGAAGQPCLTVFVPSSPTPFTGYVITVPIKDTVELGITIEDALKFAVSGGVVVPPREQINEPMDPIALAPPAENPPDGA